MATFGEMQTNIAGYLSRSDLASEIRAAIQRAVRHYERDTFWFNETEASFVTVAGTSQYTLSNSYAQLTQVIINHGSTRFEVGRENYETLNAIDTSGYQGQPDWYAERNGVLRLYPVPNATYTASYVYLQKPISLSATDVSNTFTLNAEDLIEARSCWWLNLFKLQNPQAATYWKEIELDALRALQDESTNHLSTGRLRSTGF